LLHVPPLQVSLPLQKAPSLQPVPFGSAPLQASATSLHEVAQLLSVVLTLHGLPAWSAQLPALQVSEPLQKTRSSQETELLAITQPVVAFAATLAGLQVSVVQVFESLHAASTAVMTQPVVALAEPLAGLQVSVVQLLLSLQAALTAVMTQPVAALAEPLAGLHVSVVQLLLSSHAASTGVMTHPVRAFAEPLAGLQVSVVQLLLSLHAAFTFVLVHAPEELQASVVQDLPSSQAAVQQKPPAHAPVVPFANRQSEFTEHAEPGPLP